MSRPPALAICTTALGDTLLCTPALTALGMVYELDVLVHQHRRQLLWHNPHVARILPYRNNALCRSWWAWRLRRRTYQVAVVLHANDDMLKLLPRLRYLRAGNIQGWQSEDLRLTALRLDDGMHVVDKRLTLAAWAGAPTVDHQMRVFVTPAEKTQADAWLAERDLEPGGLRVALCPGAAYPFKRWPAESFGRLAKELARDGVNCLVLGAGSEAGLANQVRRAAGLPLVGALGLSLRQACALLACVDLLVSNDTGPLHIAQAVGTPVLGLYGPTDPATIGPRGPADAVIKVPATCQPCTTKACPDPECMRALEMERVLAKVREMLAARSGEEGG